MYVHLFVCLFVCLFFIFFWFSFQIITLLLTASSPFPPPVFVNKNRHAWSYVCYDTFYLVSDQCLVTCPCCVSRLFHFARGTPLDHQVTTSALHILRRLYEIVQQRGGGATVTKDQAWMDVTQQMQLVAPGNGSHSRANKCTKTRENTPTKHTRLGKMHVQVAEALRRLYEKFLAPMEDWRNTARDSPPQPEAAEAVAIERPISPPSDDSLVGKYFWRYVAKSNAVFRAMVCVCVCVCAVVCVCICLCSDMCMCLYMF